MLQFCVELPNEIHLSVVEVVLCVLEARLPAVQGARRSEMRLVRLVSEGGGRLGLDRVVDLMPSVLSCVNAHHEATHWGLRESQEHDPKGSSGIGNAEASPNAVASVVIATQHLAKACSLACSQPSSIHGSSTVDQAIQQSLHMDLTLKRLPQKPPVWI